jgi:FMN phosphatase YigB (HAD superfamily)
MSTSLSDRIGEHDLPRHLMTALDGADTVLLDIGGVLAADSWEWLIMTPSRGLADQLELPRAAVTEVGKRLWRKYSLIPSTAEQYWSEFAAQLSIPVPSLQMVSELEDELIVAAPTAPLLLDHLVDHGVRIGIISDNTSFWYSRQYAVLGLGAFVSNDLVYLSCEYHRNKKADSSLFEIAARDQDATHTLVVDDREHNVSRARSFGFQAVRFEGLELPA